MKKFQKSPMTIVRSGGSCRNYPLIKFTDEIPVLIKSRFVGENSTVCQILCLRKTLAKKDFYGKLEVLQYFISPSSPCLHTFECCKTRWLTYRSTTILGMQVVLYWIWLGTQVTSQYAIQLLSNFVISDVVVCAVAFQYISI